MAPDPSFSAVMTGLAAGDKDAAAAVFHRFVDRVIALASCHFDPRLKSKAEPEDVVQSVYLSFLRLNPSAPQGLSDWEGIWAILATITVRKCNDRLRYSLRQKRSITREVNVGDDYLIDVRRGAEGSDWTPLEQMMLAETLEEVVQSSAPEHREIAELILQGYKGVEISKLRGCSERTVGRVMHEIRKHLTEAELAESRP
jgi:RNA polymerase sigma-70 factor, ECF subfamily